MIKFIFDLDGTVTSQETLPLIAEAFGLEDEISELTRMTIAGNVPFVESFIRRVHILGKLPVDEVAALLGKVSLYGKVVDFIHAHADDCIIATGNLDCWVSHLTKRVASRFYCSSGLIENGRVSRLTNILKKEQVVAYYKNTGAKTVFIGDGNNDIEAMRTADVSIATGLTHWPSPGVLAITDYLVFSEEALCRQLNQLLSLARA
ncbi:HAD-IB family phosphatase [Desulfovibrio sp. OttesenSCG-928-C06]|nr:HAD-IB family phosphatase [Desulfovibrio sp. OttesenSCG-928-C06]